MRQLLQALTLSALLFGCAMPTEEQPDPEVEGTQEAVTYATYVNYTPNSNNGASLGYGTYHAIRSIAMHYGQYNSNYWYCYQDPNTPEPSKTATCTHATSVSTNDVLYFYGCTTTSNDVYWPGRTVKKCSVGYNYGTIGYAAWDFSPVDTSRWYGRVALTAPSPTGGSYWLLFKNGTTRVTKRCVGVDYDCDPFSHNW